MLNPLRIVETSRKMRIAIAGLLLSFAALATTPAVYAAGIPWLSLDDTSMSRIAVPQFDAQVAVYEAGMQNKRQVVLVHGLGQNAARDWAKTIQVLAQDFHVIALDLPGFGASSKGNHPYAPAAYAQVLKAVVDAKADGPVAVVGHSMGGAVSLYFAAENADKVERLLLVDVAGLLHRSVYTGFLSRLGIRILPEIFPHQQDFLSGLAQTALGTLEQGPEPAELVFNSPSMREKLLAADPKRIAAVGLVLQDFNAFLPSVTMPTLVIWGQQDDIAPLRTGRLLAGRLPAARLRIIPGVEHSPMLEAPKVFNALLKKELSRDTEEFAAITREKAYPLKRYSESSKHDVDCDASSQELVLEGDYRHVSITSCDNVLIRNSHLASLNVHDARIVVENSHILGLGLRCNDARVEITGGSISGINAIDCQDSELDIAGVNVLGGESALKGHDTKVFFSLSRMVSDKGDMPVHGVIQLNGKREY